MSRSLFANLTEASSDQPGLRRAALFLHGCHPADRDLLLEGVSADQRHDLMLLLRELEDLGIQAVDAAQGAAALSPPAIESLQARCLGAPISHELDADWLARADVQVVSEVLAAEPDLLVARVLRMSPWRWKSTLLNLLDSERRARISEWLLDPGGRWRDHGRLDTALLLQLRRAVEQRMSALATPNPVAGQLLAQGWPTRMLAALWRRQSKGRRV